MLLAGLTCSAGVLHIMGNLALQLNCVRMHVCGLMRVPDFHVGLSAACWSEISPVSFALNDRVRLFMQVALRSIVSTVLLAAHRCS